MSPWSIIGWLLVGAFGLGVLIVAWFAIETMLIPWAWKRWHHMRTRDIPPRPGQRWMQGETTLTIVPNDRNDRISMTTQLVLSGRRIGNGASWSDSPEEWRDRVRHRRLWLLDQSDDQKGSGR